MSYKLLITITVDELSAPASQVVEFAEIGEAEHAIALLEASDGINGIYYEPVRLYYLPPKIPGVTTIT